MVFSFFWLDGGQLRVWMGGRRRFLCLAASVCFFEILLGLWLGLLWFVFLFAKFMGSNLGSSNIFLGAVELFFD